MKSLTALMISVCVPAAVMAAGAQIVSDPANLKGKEYVNPVIHGDYSDPDVTASPDGKRFYMTASSFQCAPGLPILRSDDLVNWELVNYALPAVPPAEAYSSAPMHGKGVWAPCIKVHDGKYYIYWGDPDYGVFMVCTDNPEGEWSEPVLVKAGKGLIDTTPLWDDDGKVYLANGWAGSRAGFNSVITVSEMNAEGTRVTGKPVIVFDGNDGVNHTVEGPKFYKHDGYYYLMAPAGGVETGWQLVMRSKNPMGPYESKIVMAQGGTDINGPHQGGWVETPDGRGWFLHFQDKGAYGRVVHLNPLEWKDGWPVIGADPDGDGCGEPVKRFRRPLPASGNVNYSEVQGHELFSWHSNYNDLFGFPMADGSMRIYGHRLSPEFVNMWEVPNLWLEKLPAEEFVMTADVKICAKASSEGAASGLIVMGWDYCALEVVKRADRFAVTLNRCTDAEQGGRESSQEIASLAPTRVYKAGLHDNMELDMLMRVEVSKGALCTFSYSTDGGKKWVRCGKEPFKARAGKWIGAKAGFFSVVPDGVSDRGWIDVKETVIKQ
ncbi:MAG: glycoside hydrolase 43 family protein [Muribaculaceae bacterium]|nr:glycoside hydrolase 43 family protein [Muribaculaceae bacterium]